MSACSLINLLTVLVIILSVPCRIHSQRKYTKYTVWENATIPYIITEGFSQDQVDQITMQVYQINNKTCVRWENAKQYANKSMLLVEFRRTSSGHCRLEDGQYDHEKRQIIYVISLLDLCFKDNWVIHEMMHAMGFKHEHSRTDRNCYVNVSSVVGGNDNFNIIWDDNIWLEHFPYDFYSVMHYRRDSRLQKKDEMFLAPLGNEDGILTTIDLLKISYMYCEDAPFYCELDPDMCVIMEDFEKTNECRY